MQEAGRWTGAWSGGSLGVILVLVALSLDVRRLPGLWFVSLGGMRAVDGATSFRAGALIGAERQPGLRLWLRPGVLNLAHRPEYGRSGQCTLSGAWSHFGALEKSGSCGGGSRFSLSFAGRLGHGPDMRAYSACALPGSFASAVPTSV